MSWVLRVATGDDLAAIMMIETSTFGNDSWAAETMAAELGSAHTRYLVVTPAGDPARIVAYGGVLAPVGAAEADIQTIAVAGEAQRGGIGRALMLRLTEEARLRGAREVFLEVRADNDAARALYRSLGYAQIGIRRQYYQPDGVDAIVMRAPITAPEAALTAATEAERG